MPDALLIDTTILVDLIRNHADATRYLSPLLNRGAARLHPAVMAEVLSGARDARHLRSLDAALSAVPMVRAKSDDFLTAIDLLRTHTLSTGIGWVDCLIAATALRLGLPLVTLNDKHFRPIRGLRVVRPY